ncbi:ATP-dependent RNA helicase DDX4-like [Polymixia lowei]
MHLQTSDFYIAGFGGAGRGGRRGRGEQGYRGNDEEVSSKEPRVTYVPPPLPEDEDSIFSHYKSGINFAKYDDIMVDVSGSNPPQAILTFEEAALCESLTKNVSKSGYVKPTPVQKHGIPIISAGRDIMACAQTGSGKTAAFLLPILQQLMSDGAAASRFSEQQEPEAVIVAPTRELINQIYMEARKFAHGTCVRPVVVYGGISIGHQIREMERGCNVLCGTPGRLLDMIGRGKVGLSKVRYLVLDEADRMLDMGFEPDMRKLVGSPGMPPKEERQTLMFSATYPEDIQRMAADFLKTDYLFLAVGVVGGACSDVEQTLVQVTKFSKKDQLLEILKITGTERTMVFVETKRQADFIATFLCQEKVPTTSIHGDREQREREQALGEFRSGKCPVLVATSVAARGLDIPDVQHVVNFDLPNNIDEYVHRIGRTGRCGNTGKAMSFYDPEADQQLARSLVKVLSKAQQEVPSWLEQAASSAHGTTGFNPQGKVFASIDSRKGGTFQSGNSGISQPAAQNEGDEVWE